MLKKILNLAEEVTHIRLKKVCAEYGAVIFAKVRLADVFPIEGSGISQESFRFALQAHFDFLVCDTKHLPLFAVEFDGNLHRSKVQKRRDHLKDELCTKFQLPILRINSLYLVQKYRGIDILSWFVEVWFLQKSFYEEQEAGNIPYDEVFNPCMIIGRLESDKRFPFWLAAPLQIKIKRLFEHGKSIDPAPSHAIGVDSSGNYRAIGWLSITEDSFVCAETGMRNQRFPIILSDILGELIIYELYERIISFFNGETVAVTFGEMIGKIQTFKDSYRIMSAATCGDRFRFLYPD